MALPPVSTGRRLHGSSKRIKTSPRRGSRTVKETLRIVLPWAGGCLGLLVLIFGVLAYLLNDGRRDLCDKAVEAAMKDKVSYILYEVISDEEEGAAEGRGISSFKYIYRYYNYDDGRNLHVGLLECDYVDGDTNPVHFHRWNEIK